VLSGGTVVFATGEATRTITVLVEADSNVEADEQFRVTLSEASGAVIDATANTAIGTIRNDDRPTISLAVAPARILENGGAALIYTFSRNGDPADALTVNYSVSGTALAAVDYSGIAITPTIRSLNFAAGAATALVTLTPISDSESEPDETVALTLVAGAGYSIGTTAAVVGTIADQEPLITLSLAPTTVTENGSANLSYIFSRTGSTSTALTVLYSVAGSASLASDYSGIAAGPATKSVTIAAGAASATVTVDPSADSESEADETVALSLVAGAGYRIGSTAAVVGTILDGQGYIPGPTTINGVNLGSTSLGYALRNGAGAPLQISFLGAPASPSNPGGGWGAIAATSTASGYNLYWRNSGSGEVVVWELNSSGAYSSGLLLSAAQLNNEEYSLNRDLNGDGFLAGATTLNGVNLGSTSLGYALRNGADAPLQITYPGGNASPSNPGSGWGAIAATSTASGYNLYWRNSGSGDVARWELNSSGAYTTGTLLSTSQLINEEVAVNADLNGDLITGSPLTAIESQGNASLLRQSDGMAAVRIGSNLYSVTSPFGLGAGDASSEWQMLAAETVGDQNQILWRNNPGNFLHVWTLSSSWSWQSSSGNFSPLSSAALGLETSFALDLNGNGVIG